MNDELDVHEGRRNAVIVLAVLIVGVGMVVAMFWVMRSMPAPALTAAVVVPQSTTSTTLPTTATPVPETTTFVPPTASWTAPTTPDLPPPEQPTVTDPVPGQSPDPDPNSPAPVTLPPTQVTTQPAAGPSVTNVNLTCNKNDGGKITAKVSFTTTTKINVTISAGGQVDRKQVGPGDQTVSTSGRGAGFCAAVVGGQAVGPIPAS